MIEKKTKKINGNDYEIMSFPARHNIKLFLKFNSYIGDSLKSLFSVADQKGYSGLGEGISTILSSLYANDPSCELILELLSQTTRNGIAINSSTFDTFYTGNIEEMMEALIESINVHFNGFLLKKKLFGFLTPLVPQATESLEL